jgi:hypothetical protein
MKKLLFLLIAVLPLACSEDDNQGSGQPIDDNYDYIVFGDYYGMCADKCVNIYKLDGTKVYADTRATYPKYTEPYAGKYRALSDNLYKEVRDIPGGIPYEDLVKGDTIVGYPDGADWGGIYLAVSINGEVKYWFLDKMQENLPADLRPFVAYLDQRIAVLNAARN